MAFGKEEVCAYLDERGVAYERVDHEAVFTMEAMDALALPFAEVVVKNLFLRDDKKRNYYLVVMPEDKPANLKALRTALEARPLRFASEDDVRRSRRALSVRRHKRGFCAVGRSASAMELRRWSRSYADNGAAQCYASR